VANYETFENFPIDDYRRIIVFAETNPAVRDLEKYNLGFQIYHKIIGSQKAGQAIIRICTTSKEGDDNFLLLGAPAPEILKKLESISEGHKIFRKELESQGWEDIGSISSLRIFKRGAERILWEEKNESVHTVYNTARVPSPRS
jgi:hypothetical protein